MKLKSTVAFCISGIVFCLSLAGQTTPSTQAPASTNQAASNTSTPPAEGQNVSDPNATQFPHSAKNPPSEVAPSVSETPSLWDGYETHYAFEFGGRTIAETGNRDVYATFVNLQSGLRLLDQSLEMHSVNHNGVLFDDLSESSFGLGGDPNEVIRLQATKHQWYDFSGSWRRDIDFWDYNLAGNPLNPSTNTPSVPINVSPSLLDWSRKMLDLNLTLRPESALQFVLGYSHYNNGGPGLSSVHEGTEAELFQATRDVSDTYRLGLAWRPVERTRFSFDQFYVHDRSSTSDFLNSFPYSYSNGVPVNLGVSWGNGSPCATPFVGSFANPTCNSYTGYSSTAPYYTNIPTEQLGFQTNYFRRLHITGRASYTGAQTTLPNSNETVLGFTSRIDEVAGVDTGGAKVQEITTSADGGVTYDLTERMSIDDQFRWYDYRIPSGALFLQTYLFGPNMLAIPNSFPSAACPSPYTGPGCPQHISGSSADSTYSAYSMFQSQNQKRNTVQLHYAFATHVTGYIGYRFERQDIVIDGTTSALASYFPTLPNRGGCAAPLVNGVCQSDSTSVSTAGVQINNQAGLIGIAAQPIHGLRLNGDVEIDYADNIFTNIMPRHRQLYRVKAIYTPKKWLNLNASARIEEMRDLAYGLDNKDHNRFISFGVVLSPSEHWGIDLNYSYDNFATNINICFSETPVPAFASTTPICPVGYLTAPSYYRDVDNFGNANVFVKPISRTTFTVGYSVTSTTGNSLLLNSLAPLGPAAINYNLPNAALAIDVAKHLTLKGGWNLYDYEEKSFSGPIAARTFRANLVSVSLRYAR
ncbi:MAG TPA: hypothetical protein VHZ07_17810 [Bryobacteraceae bacterium]|jgi:hypothetical protein|nr:hypothetical protein [Bryobacteraceae bacterium]